jgi:hypothetical protein
MRNTWRSIMLGAVIIGGLAAAQSSPATAACLAGRLDVWSDLEETKNAAIQDAIWRWQDKVEQNNGTSYATWANAKKSGFKCIRVNEDHRCQARARPCRK